MTRRNLIAILLALVVASACFRLGMWQLDRLAQRRERNALVTERMRQAPVAPEQLPGDSTVRFRAVRASGTFDYGNELVLTGRTRQGSPGVHVITPLRRRGSERAVLVNRGWIYSPDASSADLTQWREDSTATVEGFALPLESGDGPLRAADRPRSWRRLDPDTLAAALPYPVEPFVLVALPVAEAGDDTPVRLERPILDEGPHRGYAFQWFAFGAIALGGVAALISQDVKRRRRNAPAA